MFLFITFYDSWIIYSLFELWFIRNIDNILHLHMYLLFLQINTNNLQM